MQCVLARSAEGATGIRYKITVEETSGGVIEVSELESVAGQIVTIEAIPDDGNVVDTISACDAYSCIQPESDIRIKAVFDQKSNAKSNLQLLLAAITALCILGVCFIVKEKKAALIRVCRKCGAFRHLGKMVET